MRATYLIADLHLSERRPDISAALENFLGRIAEARELYILGDLFDYYLGDDLMTPFQEKIRQLLARQPFPVYVMGGNRDFLLGPAFACGAIQLIGDRLQRGPVLLEHGDLLCTDDRGYQRLRRLLRWRWLQGLYFALPRRLKEWLAVKLRRQSRGKSARLTDVNEGEAELVMAARGATVLIHGHTHRPGMHENRAGCRWVLGDWQPYGMVMSCYDWQDFQLINSESL